MCILGVTLALKIRDCVSLCLLDETLKADGPFYLVSMPGEVKYPTQGGKFLTCRGLHTLAIPVSAQKWAVWSVYLTKN